MLLLLFSWPPVREVCPKYEVVIFQPWTGNPPALGSFDNCYVYILLNPLDFRPWGLLPPALYLSTFHGIVSTQIIICLPGSHLYPSQHTEAHRSLHQNPNPLLPCLPSLATPAGFPTPPPCRHKNIFFNVALRCFRAAVKTDADIKEVIRSLI